MGYYHTEVKIMQDELFMDKGYYTLRVYSIESCSSHISADFATEAVL